MLVKCPGQDMQGWGADAIYDVACPRCDAAVEFFKDEIKRTCPSCGARVINDRLDLGCAAWCPQAELCTAASTPELTDEQRRGLAQSVAPTD